MTPSRPQRFELLRRRWPLAVLAIVGLGIAALQIYVSSPSFPARIAFHPASDRTPPAERVKEDLIQRIAATPAPALELAELASLTLAEAQRTQSEKGFAEAEALAHRSLKMLARQNPATLVLAKAAESRHEFKVAQALASESLQHGGGVSALMVLTTSTLAQGDLRQSARYASEAAEAEPATATYLNRALVLAALGRFVEAEFDFERALRMETGISRAESARLRFLWGRHHLRLGELDKAGQLIEAGLVATPDDRLGLQLKAEWSFTEQNWGKARDALSAAMAKGPTPRDLLLMAQLSKLQRRAEESQRYRAEAEAFLRKELKEGRRGHRLELVQALLLDDKPAATEEALALLQEESSVRQSAELYALWADAYLKKGDGKRARTMGLEAITAGGRYPAYFQRMETIETALGDLPKAKLYAGLRKTTRT